jgi:hypothetical protein
VRSATIAAQPCADDAPAALPAIAALEPQL